MHLLCSYFQASKRIRDKLDPKASKCIFVGYTSFQKGYKCYVPGLKGRLFVIMDVNFHEDIPFYSSMTMSDELLPDRSGKENVPLIDSISPPVYPVYKESTYGGGTESRVSKDGEATTRVHIPLWAHSRKRKRTRPFFSFLPLPSEALNPDPHIPVISQPQSEVIPQSNIPFADLDRPIALQK